MNAVQDKFCQEKEKMINMLPMESLPGITYCDYIMKRPVENEFSINTIYIKRDGDGFLVDSPDVPNIYAYAPNVRKAIANYLHELNELWSDLFSTDDSKLSEEWLELKNKLRRNMEK